ncbi:MAG: hypothetical protein AB1716_18835 [Planctomycetota bacterium]
MWRSAREHLGARRAVVCGVVVLLLVLNMGGCESRFLSFPFFGPPGLSPDDGYQSLNGFFYAPDIAADAYNTRTPVFIAPCGSCAATSSAELEGPYSDGLPGSDYYFSQAYYAATFY